MTKRKMSKALENELWEVMSTLRRGLAYIKQDNIAVCRRDWLASTTNHYSKPNGADHLYEVGKFIGSDLIAYQDGVDKLSRILKGV